MLHSKRAWLGIAERLDLYAWSPLPQGMIGRPSSSRPIVAQVRRIAVRCLYGSLFFRGVDDHASDTVTINCDSEPALRRNAAKGRQALRRPKKKPPQSGLRRLSRARSTGHGRRAHRGILTLSNPRTLAVLAPSHGQRFVELSPKIRTDWDAVPMSGNWTPTVWGWIAPTTLST